MAGEKEPKPDDLVVDDLDTVAGGTGHTEEAAVAGSALCHAETYCSGAPITTGRAL
jgi:hypothetical protein